METEEDEEKTSLCFQDSSSTIRKCRCRCRCPDTPSRRWNFLHHANTVICTITLIILIFTILRPYPSPKLPERQFYPAITAPVATSCGTSISEAQSIGCSFDLLAKAWLPVDCPRYGLDDFIQAGYLYPNRSNFDLRSWGYWADRDGTRELTVDEVAGLAELNKNGMKWWSTRREHLVHCSWILLRMANAFTLDLGRVDLVAGSMSHAEHCVRQLLLAGFEAPRMDEIDTEGNTVFGTC